MSLDVLYLTSFPADMFEKCGKNLLESYVRIGAPNKLLVCTEGVSDIGSKYPVTTYDLAGYDYLQRFLKTNADIIPTYLGGKLAPCRCPKRHIMHAPHLPGCRQSYMNRNMSRWFRKVASYRYASKKYDPDIMLWLDADCIFNKELPNEKLEKYFNNKSVFYFRAHRPAPETGILGFDFRKRGKDFIKLLCHIYDSKDFRKLARMDDGYVTGKVIDTKRIDTHDVVAGRKPTNNVIPYSDISEFLTHNKGSSSSKFNILK